MWEKEHTKSTTTKILVRRAAFQELADISLPENVAVWWILKKITRLYSVCNRSLTVITTSSVLPSSYLGYWLHEPQSFQMALDMTDATHVWASPFSFHPPPHPLGGSRESQSIMLCFTSGLLSHITINPISHWMGGGCWTSLDLKMAGVG